MPLVHTEEVTGSIPVSPTDVRPAQRLQGQLSSYAPDGSCRRIGRNLGDCRLLPGMAGRGVAPLASRLPYSAARMALSRRPARRRDHRVGSCLAAPDRLNGYSILALWSSFSPWLPRLRSRTPTVTAAGPRHWSPDGWPPSAARIPGLSTSGTWLSGLTGSPGTACPARDRCALWAGTWRPLGEEQHRGPEAGRRLLVLRLVRAAATFRRIRWSACTSGGRLRHLRHTRPDPEPGRRPLPWVTLETGPPVGRSESLMADERPGWARRMLNERQARGWSQADAIKAMRAHAPADRPDQRGRTPRMARQDRRTQDQPRRRQRQAHPDRPARPPPARPPRHPRDPGLPQPRPDISPVSPSSC